MTNINTLACREQVHYCTIIVEVLLVPSLNYFLNWTLPICVPLLKDPTDQKSNVVVFLNLMNYHQAKVVISDYLFPIKN